MALPPKNVHEMTGSEGNHGGKPETEHHIEQSNVVLGSNVPKVHQDDSNSIERMEHNGPDQRDFRDTHKWGLVRADHNVVSLGADTHERSVQNVHEEKKVDCYASNAV